MAKRRRKYVSRKKQKGGKRRILTVPKQFKRAMFRLRGMNPLRQKNIISGASNRFIKDLSNTMKKLRTLPHLVNSRYKQILKRNKQKLRKLISVKTPIQKKRKILSQKGGAIVSSILVPIICAAIAAGGGITGSAVHAKVLKS